MGFELIMLKDYIINQLNPESLVQWLIIIIISSIQVKITLESINKNTKKHASFCQSLGIFGTFLGICIGLFLFDAEQIENSVTGLLGGMKIAFITSVTGLFFYLYINYRISDSEESNEAELDDVVNAINYGNKNIQKGLSGIEQSVGSLQTTISGDGDGSLLNQLTLFRTNLNDKFDVLNTSFEEFATLQAENNTKALVSAIEEVIGDFNAKINEQFGDNFKQLNAAVGDLVIWQDNYKDILDKSYAQFNVASESIEKSRILMETINSQFNDNLKINEDVVLSLELMKSENEDLQRKIEAFSELSESAKESFPIIKNNLEDLTNGFKQQVDSSIDTVSEFVKTQKETAEKVMEGIETSTIKTVENFGATIAASNQTISEKVDSSIDTVTEFMKTQKDTAEKVMEGIETSTVKTVENFGVTIANSNQAVLDTTNSLKETLEASVSDISESISAGFNNAINNINNMQQKIGENLEESILEIDDALRQELEKSLHSLGTQLATLSQKFVDDYGELTTKMRTIVHMAES